MTCEWVPQGFGEEFFGWSLGGNGVRFFSVIKNNCVINSPQCHEYEKEYVWSLSGGWLGGYFPFFLSFVNEHTNPLLNKIKLQN